MEPSLFGSRKDVTNWLESTTLKTSFLENLYVQEGLAYLIAPPMSTVRKENLPITAKIMPITSVKKGEAKQIEQVQAE
ncbi:hypothetical protein PHLCEN_2v12621 [Hermanssonia centrifuga]|uniref:Uncharacterized protein n=1 Tax=Hermanssonia centrifuga TaxID=98765 RepID=A0A2R6NGQ9_9APHY|nr:hypothetical protein PHLCEN_2v12621 [Hermanssonia centrifuga]